MDTTTDTAARAELQAEKVAALKEMLLLSRCRLFGPAVPGAGPDPDAAFRLAHERHQRAAEALARLADTEEEMS
jgi:hypothetical protein